MDGDCSGSWTGTYGYSVKNKKAKTAGNTVTKDKTVANASGPSKLYSASHQRNAESERAQQCATTSSVEAQTGVVSQSAMRAPLTVESSSAHASLTCPDRPVLSETPLPAAESLPLSSVSPVLVALAEKPSPHFTLKWLDFCDARQGLPLDLPKGGVVLYDDVTEEDFEKFAFALGQMEEPPLSLLSFSLSNYKLVPLLSVSLLSQDSSSTAKNIKFLSLFPACELVSLTLV